MMPLPSPAATSLPFLRPDLELIAEADGGLVYDPIAHRFARLDELSMALIAAWKRERDPVAIVAAAGAATSGAANAQHFGRIVDFARRSGWLVPGSDAEVQATAAVAIKAQQRDWRWALHSYISFRLPLLSPEPLLDRMRPVLDVLFSRTAFVLTGLLGLVAVYLASRQWTELSAAAHGLLSPSAIALMGLTLLVVKVWHEIGHGHLARRHGCRVPSAGVMMVLGAPLFYTDVTDAWRLPGRRERMIIAAGGLAAEAMLAVAALLLWVFLPDGTLRSLCFFVATGSLLTSLLVNLSPFMRFDGYFLLSDGLRIPNLHAKAFAIVTWLLRRFLLGFDDPRPRETAGLSVFWLAAFGIATMLYRLVLFLGLALLVYHLTFKLLGIVLFAAEIIWFIAGPVWRELKVWHARRADIRWRRHGFVTVSVLLVGALLCLAPLSWHVRMKAVIEAGNVARLHAPASATVVTIHASPGDRVEAGDPVITLASPQLTQQLAIVERRLALVVARLSRVPGDAQDRALTQVLLSERSSLEAQRSGLAGEIEALVMRSPMAGRVTELDRELRPGRAVSPKLKLALIAADAGVSARAYAGAEAASRLTTPARAWFVPEDATAPRLPLTLVRIGVSATQAIEPEALAEPYGGDVPASPDRAGRHVASAAAFLLIFNGEGSPPTLAQRGSIHVEAAAESLAARALRRAASILIRESGV